MKRSKMIQADDTTSFERRMYTYREMKRKKWVEELKYAINTLFLYLFAASFIFAIIWFIL